MTKRALTPEHAERLRLATARSVLDHLRVAGVNVPANILAAGLMAVVVRIVRENISAKHQSAVIARCRASLDAAEAARGKR
ncbi:hypothetical protein [Bradyrhizobium valentinum]|uniref:Uncharacterized protein n=1 Tax=Bradyrhizobium valentinum TaxID=1518501 RepID=A0A0R3M0V7_9BRAD|nr:hypothetical protein [Bradyrhizobium valentinum]KRR11541.1 hypothetical protein CP49_18065 [Bradyrhizobium valentinum]